MTTSFETTTAAATATAGIRVSARRGLSRRELLALGSMALGGTGGGTAGATRAQAVQGAWAARIVTTTEPLRQIRAGGPSGLLGVGAGGDLWALSISGASATRLADGLDPLTPLAVGHGRIAARHADGGLWVWQGGKVQRGLRSTLAPQAGLLVLPSAVIGVAAGDHRVLRFEPDANEVWAVVARSTDAVLPDARPLQADLSGVSDAGRGDGGHLVLLAGPDSQRYTHGVLGDRIEATRVLWLERHSLEVLREMVQPAPYVIEDIAPRLVTWGRGSALLTVRSGPQGGQLGLVAASPAQPRQLQWAALGEALGTPNRWMSPTTDGTRLLAVHTPHIGGVLHDYRADGDRLVGRAVARNVSTHRIGSRELDLAVWLGPRLVLPTQNGLALRVLDANAAWAEMASVTLPNRVVMTAALHSRRSSQQSSQHSREHSREQGGEQGLVALLEDGQVVACGIAAR